MKTRRACGDAPPVRAAVVEVTNSDSDSDSIIMMVIRVSRAQDSVT